MRKLKILILEDDIIEVMKLNRTISSLKLISSILNTFTSVFLALTVPLKDGRLGEIPVGVKERAQGSGRLII